MSVGVIVPDVSDGYFPEVMNAIELHLLKSQYFFVTASHYRRPEVAKECSLRLMNRSIDGLLLLDTDAGIELPIPAVAISSHNKTAGVANIILDHDRAAHLALSHLRELGHRHIALMKGPPGITDAQYRWDSILKACRELGIEATPELCIHMEAVSQSPEAGYRYMKELLHKTRDFTAVFCFNDIAAIGAVRAIRDAGLHIPGDISILGFDDILAAAYYEPALTTVKQPLGEMGAKAAELLLARIESPEQEWPAEVVMEPQLIVRESTGPVSV
jgi:LacI family transcriptional regulator